jgi:hypothetical protein
MELDSLHEAITRGITAIAQCPSTLELLLQEASLTTAVEYLKEMIPVSGVESREVLKRQLYNDIALSEGEIDAAWKHLCAFEKSGKAWRPNAARVIDAWNPLKGAIDEAHRNNRPFSKTGDLVSTIDLESEEFEWTEGGEAWENAIRDIWAGLDANGVLEREICVKWIGEKVLEHETTGEKSRTPALHGMVGMQVFLEIWRDAMPERWREDVTGIQILNRSVYEKSNGDMVRWVDAEEAARLGSLADGSGDAGTEKTGLKGSGARKWHEKFKAGRR